MAIDKLEIIILNKQLTLDVSVSKVLPNIEEWIDNLVELSLDAPSEVHVVGVFVPL